VGLSVSPQSLLQNDFTEQTGYSAIGLGLVAHTGQFTATKLP
jgi:hypothetical protein